LCSDDDTQLTIEKSKIKKFVKQNVVYRILKVSDDGATHCAISLDFIHRLDVLKYTTTTGFETSSARLLPSCYLKTEAEPTSETLLSKTS
jgi:hypothetical protein